MYDIPLYMDRPNFEKVAVTVKLPDDHTKWAPQVLSELHRQSPVMRDFHAEIILDRMEPNRGAGFGYVIARPKTTDPLAAQALPSIKIPIFIKNWHLSPIDIFFSEDGRGYYLSERRIREALTRPATIAGGVSKEDPVSDDIRTLLTPPWENVGQFYRGTNTQVSQGAQVKTSMLKKLDGTVDSSDIAKLAQWVNSDEGKSSLWGNNSVRPLVSQALRLDTQESKLGSMKIAESNGSPVIQYRWDGGPFMQVKIAQPGGFAPAQGQVPAGQAAQQMTPEMQAQLAQQGQAVQADQMQVMTPDEMDGDDFKPVDQFGVYRVITVNNEQLMGWVFPFILSFKMEKVPQQIFTDGSNFATQQSIPGVHVATNANLPNEQPQGRGFFYIIRNGRAYAFAPLELQGEQQQPDGNVMFMGQTILGGNPVQIMKIDGMKAAAEMGEGQFAIPGDVKWCSFKQQTNPMVEDPTQASQRAGAYTLQKIQQKAMMEQQAQAEAAEKGKKGRKKTASFNKLAKFNKGIAAAAGLAAAAPAAATYKARKDLEDEGFSAREAKNITGGYGRNAVQGLMQGSLGMGLSEKIMPGSALATGGSALLGGGVRAAQIMQDANRYILDKKLMDKYTKNIKDEGEGEVKESSAPITAVIRATQDNTYTLTGNAFNKLASKYTHFLDATDAEWMLALAGVEPKYTQKKLAHIHHVNKGMVEIPTLRVVEPKRAFEVKTASLTKVCSKLSKFMVKHASEIRDPNIADKLLALNFLNPRNVSMFIGYLPTLEESTSNLANLLVASRLGEASVNEGACVEALRSLEDVVTGLKMLAMTRESV